MLAINIKNMCFFFNLLNFNLQIIKKYTIMIKASKYKKEVNVMDEVPTVERWYYFKKLNTSLLLNFLSIW